MDAINYSTARKHLVRTMENVCDDHEPVIITRKNARAVVMLSLDDYNAMQETFYLMSNPANAKRLRESIEQYKKGKYESKDLLE